MRETILVIFIFFEEFNNKLNYKDGVSFLYYF